MTEIKILGSFWMHLRSHTVLGIVVIDNGFEEKAYIGECGGIDQKLDEKNIVKNGSKFPLKQAKELI